MCIIASMLEYSIYKPNDRDVSHSIFRKMNKQSTLPWERKFFFGEEFVLDEVACIEAAFTYILVSRAYAPIIKHST